MSHAKALRRPASLVPLLLSFSVFAAADPAPIEARTATGDVVLLHPNGRWVFVDQAKAEAAGKVAETYPENRTRPIDAQGGWFGVGRVVMPGDKDYNRGSMGGKGR